MDHYAGLDVSLALTSVCLIDARGEVVREAKVASEPDALVRFLAEQQLPIVRVALEAGPLSQWLHAGLIAAGFETVLLETRHVKAALCAMTVKTDRREIKRSGRPHACPWSHRWDGEAGEAAMSAVAEPSDDAGKISSPLPLTV